MNFKSIKKAELNFNKYIYANIDSRISNYVTCIVIEEKLHYFLKQIYSSVTSFLSEPIVKSKKKNICNTICTNKANFRQPSVNKTEIK